MRGKIIDALFERMARDERVFFLTADMGINLVERFGEAYPDRFLNVGIAEQNLIGVSAGLCNAGFTPVVYTISNFLTHRCFEQIRNDVALHEYPVILLGTSTGYDNAPLGPTHHVIDDWGAIAGIPGIDIYCPSSVAFAAPLIDRLLDGGRPAYVRVPKGQPAEPASAADVVYLPGKRARTLIATYGSPAQNVLRVAASRDDVSVLVFNRLKPIDWAQIAGPLSDHETVIVVEDHFPEQGLFGTLCCLCMEAGVHPRVLSLAPQTYNLTVGTSGSYYEAAYGIDVSGINAMLDGLPAPLLLRT
jgi:transketolase